MPDDRDRIDDDATRAPVIYTWTEDEPPEKRLREELGVLCAKLRHDKPLDLVERDDALWWFEYLRKDDRFLRLFPKPAGRPRERRRRLLMAIDYMVSFELHGPGASAAAEREVASDWGIHERKVRAAVRDNRKEAEERIERAIRWSYYLRGPDRRAALRDLKASIAGLRGEARR